MNQRTALLYLSVMIIVSGCHTANAKIKLLGSRFTTAANGEPITHVTIAVTPATNEDGSSLNQTKVELLYNGTLRPKPKQVLLTNEKANIAGINFVPATKLLSAYLILQRSDGTIVVMPDFNERIANLCKSHKKPFFDGYCEIAGIRGNLISICSADYGEATYSIVVSVSDNNSIHLIKYEKFSWK